MAYKRLFFKSFAVSLIIMMIAIGFLSPGLGLAQDGETNQNQIQVLPAEAVAEDAIIHTDHPDGLLVGGEVEELNVPPNVIDFDNVNQIEDADRQLPNDNNLVDSPDTMPPNQIIIEGMETEIGFQDRTDPGVLVIPSADFRHDGVNSAYFFPFHLGFLRGDSNTDNACMMAPAYLPHGVTITSFWATIKDNSASNRIYLHLIRLDNYSGVVTFNATIETTNPYTNPNFFTAGTATIINPLVQYPSYSYYVAGCWRSADVALANVRIYYSR